jgi:hypothetical protein
MCFIMMNIINQESYLEGNKKKEMKQEPIQRYNRHQSKMFFSNKIEIMNIHCLYTCTYESQMKNDLLTDIRDIFIVINALVSIKGKGNMIFFYSRRSKDRK